MPILQNRTLHQNKCCCSEAIHHNNTTQSTAITLRQCNYNPFLKIRCRRREKAQKTPLKQASKEAPLLPRVLSTATLINTHNTRHWHTQISYHLLLGTPLALPNAACCSRTTVFPSLCSVWGLVGYRGGDMCCAVCARDPRRSGNKWRSFAKPACARIRRRSCNGSCKHGAFMINTFRRGYMIMVKFYVLERDVQSNRFDVIIDPLPM